MRPYRLALRAAWFALLLFEAGFSPAQPYPESTYQQLHWRMIGPFRGGRTRAVAGVPSQPNIFYIGAVNGGVWKSDDYGRTWNPIFDRQPTQSIGAIAVAPSDPNIVYVGSGEGLHRPDLSIGNGIYKSTDGGKNWKHLGLSEGQQIPALAVDPRDPNRLFAAVLGHPYGASTERGIFRSLDGGVSWQKVLYKDENTGASDVAIDPSRPEVVYAALWEVREGPWEDNNAFVGTGGGLFKSTDGGDTWKPLTKGLPNNVAQINLALAPSRPSRIYASVGTTEKGAYGSGAGLGVYRSDDAGESWHRATEDPRPAMRIGGGDLAVLRVDPKNPDVVYSASIVTFRSTDGGKNWTGIRGAPGGDDYQNLWINPNDPKVILLVADQGGIVTVNGGASWSSWYNQPSAQLYHAAVTSTFPYKVCSGQQESGSVCISSRGNDGVISYREWRPVGVIEYGYAAPDPLDPDLVYGAGRTQVSKFHWSTGQVQNVTPIPVRSDQYRGDRTQPVRFSPIDPHILYYAANVLFKTTDGGNSWETISPDLTRPDAGAPPSVTSLLSKNPDAAKQRGVIYSLAPSFQNLDTLWAGTDDGWIWITRDGGKHWTNITPPDLTPWSKVTQIEASHFDPETAYATVSRFRIDDLRPYIYRTHDGGKSWQRIVDGLPQGPADTVREDPVRRGLLFAGTENAVWVSFDDGDHWQSLELNLPHTSMRDLWIKDNDLIVATHGRSFWILDDITPLRQITAATASAEAELFQPGVAYRIRRSTYPDTPVPPDEPLAENPPDGAVIDYFLSQPASSPLTIEILDSAGKLVRRYSSADQPAETEAELEKQLIPLYWIQMPITPSTVAGAHRWVWDLHYPAPTATHHEYPISAVPGRTPRVPLGPIALPGDYSVRLTANGHAYTAPLVVKMDPRVETPPTGIRQMFELETSLASLLTSTSVALLEAHSVAEQLHQLSGKASGGIRDSIEQFRKKLEALSEGEAATGSPASPTLKQANSAVGTLYEAVGMADATPTVAQVETAQSAEQTTTPLLKQWTELTTTELPALNHLLRAAGLPEVRLQSNASAELDPGDEE